MLTTFQSMISAEKKLKSFIEGRIAHCFVVSLDYAPTRVVDEKYYSDVFIYQLLHEIFYAENYERVCERHDLAEDDIKKLFQKKKFSNIVTAFKFEKGIPLDAPIINTLNEIHKKRRSKK